MLKEKNKDFELIEAFKAGKVEVFDELIGLHASKLYQTAYGLLSNREDAEEVVQDAFVRAYKALGGFRGDASFETWIYRIVVNLSRNKYQWNRRRGAELNVSMTHRTNNLESDEEGEEMIIPDKSYKPDSMLEGVEFEERVMGSFNELPDKIKEAMILRHVNEFSYEEISNLMESKVGTIKSRIARGREMLRKILTGSEGKIGAA